MENMSPGSPAVSNRKVIKISKKKIVWIIIIIIIAFIAYGGLHVLKRTFGTNYSSSSIQIPCIQSPGVNCGNEGGSAKYNSNYYPNSNAPSIQDTREFMKVSYNASLKTRNVESVTHDVKNAIELADGRIDNLSEGTLYSQVSFVVPKTNFEDFKNEIESLTHKKLYTENTNSQNLLTQKQSIEQQTQIASENLLSLQQKQQSQTTAHNKRITDLQNELRDTQINLAVTQTNYTKTPNDDLKGQVTVLTSQESSIKQSIANENASYASSNQNLQNQINASNTTLANLGKQDVQFTDNVETVNGFISVAWISWWNILKIFSPIHPTFLVIILVIVLWLCIRRKSYVPKVEFV